MANLIGIKKEFMQNASFKMLLDEAIGVYPKPQEFNPYDARSEEKQINEWKSKSSEKAGFDTCFKMLTGITPEEYTK